VSAPKCGLDYEEKDGVATITVNRQVAEWYRLGTYEEVADAIRRAGWKRGDRVIV
jgi:hypothetical protein